MAAVPMTPGQQRAVTLAATVTQLSGFAYPAGPHHGSKMARTLVVWESDVDVYVVTGSVDGATLPSVGARLIGTVIKGSPVEIAIDPSKFLGIAGSGVGTASCEVR